MNASRVLTAKEIGQVSIGFVVLSVFASLLLFVGAERLSLALGAVGVMFAVLSVTGRKKGDEACWVAATLNVLWIGVLIAEYLGSAMNARAHT
jgi:hypothetical protein